MSGENADLRMAALIAFDGLHDDTTIDMDHQTELADTLMVSDHRPGAFQQLQCLLYRFKKGLSTLVEHYPIGTSVKQGNRKLGFQPLDALGYIGGRNIVFFGGLGKVLSDGGITKISQLQQFIGRSLASLLRCGALHDLML